MLVPRCSFWGVRGLVKKAFIDLGAQYISGNCMAKMALHDVHLLYYLIKVVWVSQLVMTLYDVVFQ